MIRFIAFFLVATVGVLPASAQSASLEVTQRPLSIGTAARGSQRVGMLDLTFKAGCDGDAVLETLTVHHRGLGDSNDIARIYALQDGRRITRSRSFDTKNRTAELRFRGMTIPACDEATLTIAADIASDAEVSGEHALSLRTPSDITLASGEATLRSASSSLSVRTAPVSKGVITASYPDLRGNTIRFGKNRLVGRIKLEADRESDHFIHAITITNDGKAREADLSNIGFFAGDGTKLSSVSSMKADAIHFLFKDPIVLRKNQSRQFEIRASVNASRRKTVRLLIEEPGDIEAEEKAGRTR